jgi:peroxiredoxin
MMSEVEPRRVLALIPAYNEGARVADVVRGALAFLPVLVVNDGSTDDTPAHAERAGATVLHQVPNQGKGAALRAGFHWALAHGYDAVIALDADGQHDPAEIPLFLDAFRARRPDLIIGERRFTQMPFPRNLTNTIGRWLFSWALGQRVHDNQSGYRLISRRLMEATLASREEGFEFEVEMIVTCVRQGMALEGVPIRTIYGDERSHIRPWHHLVHYMRVIRHTRRATGGTRQGALQWLPLAILPLVGILAAALIILSTRDGDGDSGAPAASFPSPPPVTFVPPTPRPTAPPTVVPAADTLIDEPVPDITLTTLDGGEVRLRDLAGQVVFLNFWATWCEPCQREMPALQDVLDARGDAVRVIGITDPDQGQTEYDIRAFVEARDLTLTVALSSDLALYQRFSVLQIPMTFVIDREGIVRFRHIGEIEPDDIAGYLDRLGEGA